MSLDDRHIHFNPQQIQAAAEALRKKRDAATMVLNRMEKRSRELGESWSDSNADHYRQRTKELHSQAKAACDRISQLIQQLEQVAGIYLSGETQATRQAETLPTEGVFQV